MENESLEIDTAIKYLQAGYHLYAIVDKKEERFYKKENRILISSFNKAVFLDVYAFRSLYDKVKFHILDDSAEDAVDMKKDEEYYSWRQ